MDIVSDPLINPAGNLTVVGDLDLSGLRYGPGSDRNDPARRGFGEPGVLNIRAAGDLTIHGSINDGFARRRPRPTIKAGTCSSGAMRRTTATRRSAAIS